ncbi:MAG: electron transfer flavoprotein subunit alpha/FixB family protein, partial [Saprospiraceae bacterium]|nr:electron transfer flavoprotein subunit alpha/FixB family protein [Saprospiraceae bacterium]
MVLVFAESEGGKFKKAAFESVSYGKAIAGAMGTQCAALVVGTDNQEAGKLGIYGADKVYQIASDSLNHFDSQTFTKAIAGTAMQIGAKVIVLSHSSTGKSLVGRLAVNLEAGSVSGVNSLPTVDGGFKVKKSVYSGKAIATYEITTDYKVLSLMGNAFPPAANGAEVAVENISIDTGSPKVKVLKHETVTGTVPLPEAELVVSAGRGLKGPENWGMVEDLAKELGATTACSRPVADAGWRPHHEHVGQTGIAIRPNLYIAIGISGAIQHLAGVNN